MSELLTFEDVQRLFSTLGVQNFGAALPEGRIQWMDASGQVVAQGRCAAVLSWAAANQSICWADSMPHFQSAGVPVLLRPEGLPPYQEGMDLNFAQNLAARAAQGTGAQFLYQAKTGGGGQLFLAISEFTPGSGDGAAEDVGQRMAHMSAWLVMRLGSLADHIEKGANNGPDRLKAFAGEARNQADYALRGTALADQLRALASDAERWAEALPDGVVAVVGALRAAAKGMES